MSYFIDSNSVNGKDPVKLANMSAWMQRTGGHEGRKWHQMLTEDLAGFAPSFWDLAPRHE